MIDIVLIIIVFMYNIGSIVFIYCNHHQKQQQQQTLLFKVLKKVKVERKMASDKVDVDPLYCPPSWFLTSG